MQQIIAASTRLQDRRTGDTRTGAKVLFLLFSWFSCEDVAAS
jgi:hypothetical protein